MCIIIAKPAGTEAPSRKVLKTCFENNPDGAGIMWATGETVEWRKGMMTFLEFEEAVDELGDVTDMSVVYHFRITTHGGTSAGCCHPFPVTDDVKSMSATSGNDAICVAHNGTIPNMTTKIGVSDTMAYVRDVLAPLRRISNSLVHDDALSIIEVTLNSKMALMNGAGDISTIGEFYEVDGVLYSNTSYMQRTYGYSSYREAWDDYEDFYADKLEPVYPICKHCDCMVDCALYGEARCSELDAIRLLQEDGLITPEDVDELAEREFEYELVA